jgi:Uma2 family endonuclease
MSPKNWAHVIATKLILRALENALLGRASVYQEAPLLVASLDSEPEPDVLVCSNPDELAYRSSRTQALLVVEVAEASVAFDLGEKAGLYAQAGVPEYWVLDLVDRVLVVFREPISGTYRLRLSLDETARVTPGPWPDLAFEVSKFLPPVN